VVWQYGRGNHLAFISLELFSLLNFRSWLSAFGGVKPQSRHPAPRQLRQKAIILLMLGLVSFLTVFTACSNSAQLATPTSTGTPELTATPILVSPPKPSTQIPTSTIAAATPTAVTDPVLPTPFSVFARPQLTPTPTGSNVDTNATVTPAQPSKTTIGKWTFETFTGFERPQGLLFDGEFIWVVDVGADSVIKMSLDGVVLARTEVGLFPRALAFDGEKVWVANAGHNTISTLDRDGELLSTLTPGGGATGPAALIYDGKNVWVAAAWGNRIVRLDHDGETEFSIRIPGEHPAPSAMTFDGESIWVASLNVAEVQKLDVDNEQLEHFKVGSRNTGYLGVGTFTGGQGPTSVAFDGENIWVTTNWLNLMTKLNKDGEILGEYEVGRWPISVTSDGESIWVANWWDDSVMRLALDGTILDTLPVGSHPIAVISAEDAIWVALEDAESVAKITLSPQTQTAQPDTDETTLRVALASFGVETLDPSLDGSGGLQYHGHMFDHLLGATPDGQLSTDLGALERWEASADAASFTLTLKPNMPWHDGDEVTSEDIKFSMSHYAREGATCGGCPGLNASLDHVEIVDTYTAILHLKIPDVSFMHRLGSVVGDMPLLPHSTGGRSDDDRLQEIPTGSGPWKYAERTAGDSIEYLANTDYWNVDRVPGFDRLQIMQVPDPETRVALLRSGAVDLSDIKHTDIDSLKTQDFAISGPKYVTATTMRLFMGYDPDFLTSSLEFRKALVLGMDLKTIVTSIYPPEAASVPTGSTLFSPFSDGYVPELPSYPHDPERARELLVESGYAGEPIDLFSIVAYGITEMPLMNEMIAEQWKQIGLNVRIIPTDFPQVLAHYAPRPQNFDGDSPAPLFHGALPGQPNVVNSVRRYMTTAPDGVMSYHDLDAGDRIYAELLALADPEERELRLKELNRELYDQYWAVDIVWRHGVFGLSPLIGGWEPTDGTSYDLHLETISPRQ